MQNTAAILSGTLGVKGLSMVVYMVAARELSLQVIGMVFFVEAMAAMVFKTADFGFYDVLIRRSARGQTDRLTVARAYRFRAWGIGLCVICFAVALGFGLPDQSGPILGFFLARGVFHLHELGRAMLVGREHFVLNAGLSLVSRLLGTVLAVTGLLLGGGIWAWMIATLLAEILQFALIKRCLRRLLPDPECAAALPLLQEGLTFWVISVIRLLREHLFTILLSLWLPLRAVGLFGLANRVAFGSHLVVSSLSFAAFPGLARQREALISARQATLVLLLACGMGGAVLLLAPWIAAILVGQVEPELALLLRILAPGITLLALVRPLEVWLRAKDQERALVKIGLVELSLAVSTLALLAPRYRLTGAALAILVGALIQLVGEGWVAWLRVRRSP